MVPLHGLGELVMKHRGARICVMGGGPRLAADIERVEADVWISSNAHGAKLRPVDYVVAMDNLHTITKESMEGQIRPFTDAPIIGPWQWSDYGITNYPLMPRLIFSGVMAQWVACVMGGHPVIMAGFDCYGSRAHRSYGQHVEMKPHIACEVRVVSGLLTSLWPEYDLDEVLPPYVAPDVFAEYVEHGVHVQVRKPVELRGRIFPIGTVLHVPRAEVWRQIKHRSLIEVPASAPVHQLRPVVTAKRKSRRKAAA